MNPLHANTYSKQLLVRQLYVLTGQNPQELEKLGVEELQALRDRIFDEVDRMVKELKRP